jgi:hypothetical protein
MAESRGQQRMQAVAFVFIGSRSGVRRNQHKGSASFRRRLSVTSLGSWPCVQPQIVLACFLFVLAEFPCFAFLSSLLFMFLFSLVLFVVGFFCLVLRPFCSAFSFSSCFSCPFFFSDFCFVFRLFVFGFFVFVFLCRVLLCFFLCFLFFLFFGLSSSLSRRERRIDRSVRASCQMEMALISHRRRRN